VAAPQPLTGAGHTSVRLTEIVAAVRQTHPMSMFVTLLTGGGILAAGALLTGLLTNWLDARRDKRRYIHEKEMTREARRQERLQRTYTDLGIYLAH
jgi:hypothetical protein